MLILGPPDSRVLHEAKTMDSLSTEESNASTASFDDEVPQQAERSESVGTPPTSGSPGSPGSPPGSPSSALVPTEPPNTDITGDLWRLHADELTWLAQRKRPVVKPGEGYFARVGIGNFRGSIRLKR